MKSYLLNLTALSALVAAGLFAGCDSKSSPAPSGEAGSPGEPSASAGTSSSAGGSGTSEAGTTSVAAPDSAGAAGQAQAEGGAAGSVAMAGSAGAAEAGEGGSSALGGSATIGGSSGFSGASGGSAGKAGSGGTSGSAGSGGASGGASGGTSGSAGSGGAPPTLYIPASLTCAAGNVLAAYSVCRNCHGASPNPSYTVPFTLISYADVTSTAKTPQNSTVIAAQYAQVNAGIMPLSGSFGAAATCSNNGTLTCKQVLLNWLQGGSQGVAYPGGVCP